MSGTLVRDRLKMLREDRRAQKDLRNKVEKEADSGLTKVVLQRIEEQLIVTADGSEVITRFPAEDLLVTAGGQYTVGGHVPGMREVTSNLNANGHSVADAVVASARNEGANAG